MTANLPDWMKDAAVSTVNKTVVYALWEEQGGPNKLRALFNTVDAAKQYAQEISDRNKTAHSQEPAPLEWVLAAYDEGFETYSMWSKFIISAMEVL